MNKFYSLLSVCVLLTMQGSFTHALAAADKTVVEVPFTLQDNNIILQVKVGGKGPFNMMLITGSCLSALSGQFLHELRHLPFAQGRLNARVGTIEIGEMRISSLGMQIRSLEEKSRRAGIPIHGILGCELLTGRIIQIDYPRRVVRFLQDPLPAAPSGQAARLSMDIKRDVPLPVVEEVFVEGKKMKALIDTGQDVALSLTPAAVDYLGLPATRDKAPRVGAVGSLKIGSLQADAPRTAFFGKDVGLDHELSRFGAVIGAGLLIDYVVTFDYKSKVITLERK